ncbi:MAG: hydroxymethylbilane synthase [Clostridia bacterium]|jgi:hydroxymethylbilane synthase|nr:hydroxymethylbilane synthase [Clostridia bacterium]
MKTIRIGTRKSLLAMKQTEMTAEAIKKAYPDIYIEIVEMTTKGDKILDKPLLDIGGKGLFITEFEKAMRDGLIDIAVHSGKDIPNTCEKDFGICAVLKRGNPKDCIVSRKDTGIPDNSVIGTGSLRRKTLIKRLYPKCEVKNLRGNVPTRIKKLKDGEYDAIILACAGLERLEIKDECLNIMPFDEIDFVPAASQGIIAVEALKSSEVFEILKKIDNEKTHFEFDTERLLMSYLGADCHESAGAFAKTKGDYVDITCFYKNSDIITKRFLKIKIKEEIRKIAEGLL